MVRKSSSDARQFARARLHAFERARTFSIRDPCSDRQSTDKIDLLLRRKGLDHGSRQKHSAKSEYLRA